jgi:hypothetical protein
VPLGATKKKKKDGLARAGRRAMLLRSPPSWAVAGRDA